MTTRSGNRSKVGRTALAIWRSVGEEIRRLRLDAGITQRRLADAAGIDQGFLSRIEAGTADASTVVLVAIGQVLGADLAVRFYPTTGPRIHDRIQEAMSEVILRESGPNWRRLVEVRVSRPARGSIDVVLADLEAPAIVAVELQSDLRRIEQQVRWAADKAASLPSAEEWPMVAGSMLRVPLIGRLMVLRSTARTRELARDFETLLSTAYPASSAAAVDALRGRGRWPGEAIVWCRVENETATLLPGPPRGVGLGR